MCVCEVQGVMLYIAYRTAPMSIASNGYSFGRLAK